MNAPPPPVLPPEKPRRFARIWWGIRLTVTIGLCLGLVYVVFRVGQFGYVASRLPQERAAARREGIPLTPADLRRNPPVPDSRNAAPLYRKLTAILTRQEVNRDKAISDLLRERNGRTEADRKAAREVLARRRPLLEIAERAAALPHCDFKRPYEQGMAMKQPEYAAMRHMARLLAARALLESDAGQPEKAFASIAAGARIAAHAGEDSGMLMLLLQVTIRSILDRAYHEALSAHSDKPGIAALAEMTESAFDPRPDLRYSLGAEVVMGSVVSEQMRTGTLPRPENEAKPDDLPRRSPKYLIDGWESNMLSLWREAHARLDRAGSDPMAQHRAMLGMEKRFDSRTRQMMNVLAAILMPGFEQVSLKMVEEEAQRQMRRTTALLVGYRQKTGRYPERLDQLPTPAPPDPFTGKPSFYQRAGDGDGFRLYSVGRNLRDDGGREKRSSNLPNAPDDTDIVVDYAR